MAASTRYTFYGVVEDPITYDRETFLAVDPAAFGYGAGQRLTGSLALQGGGAAIWTGAPESGRNLSTNVTSDLDLFFPQAATGGWREGDLTMSFQLSSSSDRRPLDQLSATLFHANEPDGPTLRLNQLEFGGARLTKDDDRTAFVYGAWIPEGVTPNLVYGGRSADTLDLRGTLTLAWGGRGADSIHVKSGEALAWGQQGNDGLYGAAGRDHLYGGFGNDDIDGLGGDDVLSGDEGDDRITGGTGNDRIDGGLGDDLVEGNGGDDYLDAGGGLDRVLGGVGNDIIVSGQGRFDDSFVLLRSVSDGGSGNDHIIARFDAVLTGGSGADLFELGNAAGRLDNIGGLTVTDFRPGIDKMRIYAGEPEQYDTYEEIMARAKQVGADVVFDFFPTSTKDLPSLVLENLRLSALKADDFIFGG